MRFSSVANVSFFFSFKTILLQGVMDLFRQRSIAPYTFCLHKFSTKKIKLWDGFFKEVQVIGRRTERQRSRKMVEWRFPLSPPLILWAMLPLHLSRQLRELNSQTKLMSLSPCLTCPIPLLVYHNVFLQSITWQPARYSFAEFYCLVATISFSSIWFTKYEIVEDFVCLYCQSQI